MTHRSNEVEPPLEASDETGAEAIDETVRAGRGGGARRPRPALDPAPDGLHPRREQAVRRLRGGSARSVGSRTLDDDEGLVVRRGELAFVVLNLYPYAPGHLMVCPYRHIADYTETTDEEAAEIADLTRTAMRVLRAVSGAAGLQHRDEPGRRRRRRDRRPPAPARRTPLAG